MRPLSGNLRAEYAAEREAHPIAHTNIVPLEQKDEPWSISRRLALAAAIALFAVIGAVAIGTVKRGGFANWGNGARYCGRAGHEGSRAGSERGMIEGIESSPPLADEESLAVHRHQRRQKWRVRTRQATAAAWRLVGPKPRPCRCETRPVFERCSVAMDNLPVAKSRTGISTLRATATSRKTRSSPWREPAFHFLDRRRYRVVFQRPALR